MKSHTQVKPLAQYHDEEIRMRIDSDMNHVHAQKELNRYVI
jgi:hypothetical protein